MSPHRKIKGTHSRLESVKYDADDIKRRYILLFVPYYLYGPDDIRIYNVQRETFDNGVSRLVVSYGKRDVNAPTQFLDDVHYDDWQIPDNILETFDKELHLNEPS